ncbi:hypothetical protein [Bacillus mycoides]|uniref:hypothetical protein n=1 Tax=Bacillus mycoides TaxID=1405 RepID=UPI00366C6091
MFKTLLAGTLLSTELLAGDAVGTADVKTDKLKSNEKIEWRQTNKSEKESAKEMEKVQKLVKINRCQLQQVWMEQQLLRQSIIYLKTQCQQFLTKM